MRLRGGKGKENRERARESSRKKLSWEFLERKRNERKREPRVEIRGEKKMELPLLCVLKKRKKTAERCLELECFFKEKIRSPAESSFSSCVSVSVMIS